MAVHGGFHHVSFGKRDVVRFPRGARRLMLFVEALGHLLHLMFYRKAFCRANRPFLTSRFLLAYTSTRGRVRRGPRGERRGRRGCPYRYFGKVAVVGCRCGSDSSSGRGVGRIGDGDGSFVGSAPLCRVVPMVCLWTGLWGGSRPVAV